MKHRILKLLGFLVIWAAGSWLILLTPLPAFPADAVVVQHPPSFAMKHPRLHKCWRRTRRTCQVLLPVAQFTGSVAQTALFVLKYL